MGKVHLRLRPSIHTFSSSMSSSSDLLSDEGSEDVLFITSSILAGFKVLLFLLLGFLLRELAYIQRDIVGSVRKTLQLSTSNMKVERRFIKRYIRGILVRG